MNELARQAGVSKSYLSTLENDRHPSPGIGRIVAIARALEMPLEILVDGESSHRLLTIARAHRTNVDEHGGVSGYCLECELVWPCPTFRWATELGVTSNCSWDLDDCAFDEHDHGKALL